MAKTTEPQKLTVLVGDVQTFYPEYLKFKDENIVHREFISSQVVQIPNPNFIKGISINSTPEVVTSALISAVIFFTPKKVEEKK